MLFLTQSHPYRSPYAYRSFSSPFLHMSVYTRLFTYICRYNDEWHGVQCHACPSHSNTTERAAASVHRCNCNAGFYPGDMNGTCSPCMPAELSLLEGTKSALIPLEGKRR